MGKTKPMLAAFASEVMTSGQKLTLHPHQEALIKALEQGKRITINVRAGAGKIGTRK
jgi:hypothetical protein